ncbi:Bifunctional cytochrome P450/NADPH--P450 reductase [Pseudocercospora fuligena]|uniref:Bifunctional cytochrome P450/NADPH--P450 reductase n=1 Tax=Pseudocercospora fuligena TaxID=685502 RepID=A0A8H6VC47_9PEZI|nr:Bifunctional cytochrome P450/NADPH--P450 reductase [Pseudocercospora fuligena]
MAAIDKRDTVPIPQPAGYPIIGNILEVSGDVPIMKLADLGKKYGDIFSLNLLGKRQIFVASAELMRELCDEKRFSKDLGRALFQLRNGVHDGLFTAYGEEENWNIAHRTLVPAFGPLNIKDMFDSMKDIASQLVLKWARHGTAYKIPVADDLTRLTLDTLALCAMDYRFNSFYTEDMHPFIDSMVNFLKYADVRAKRPGWMSSFYKADEAKWWSDIEYMRNLSADLIQQRRDNPNNSRDLLNAMIKGKDPRTQKSLPESSIIDNMITFLIAGHETTSGMLSYAFYCLLKNPDTYRKAQEEVDRVIGKESIEAHHLDKLPYITAVLRETARLHSTAPAFSLSPKSEHGEVIGGKYHISHGETALVLLHNVHRDPAIYGDDAEDFRPERMLDANFSKITPYWKPFGNGARGCIGRPFAWQEMVLVLPMLLQYFNFTMDDPSYVLQTAFTLTIKPKDLFMRATLREGWTPLSIERHLAGSTAADVKHGSNVPVAASESDDKGMPMTILYGSNSGTCEVFAQTLAADARAHGFKASKVDTLDTAKQNLPSNEPVVIVTASYEGEPTDNAAHFYNWLQNLPSDEKLKMSYAVFGCGHSDWKQTFHRVPKAIDSMLEKAGGERICDMGSADAAKGDMMSAFQAWEDERLWPALRQKFGGKDGDTSEASSLAQAVSIEVFSKRASNLRTDVSEAKVLSTKTLTASGAPVKKHIELQLPSSLTYRAGDYLAILPLNPEETVHRVAKRFSLPWDAMLKITSRTGTTLPTEHPVSAHNLFSAYLELSQPATKRNVAMLIEAAGDDKTKKELSDLVSGDFQKSVTDKRISLLDLLERYPEIQLPLSAFVASLISMRVRQYSISSSPLSNPNVVTLTYAVLDEPSLSGVGRHVGVASHYLSQLQPGDIVHVAVKPSHAAFHLPSSAETTPVIMIAAGAGLAPFRGFIQERAAQIGSGRKLAPAHLYFGCRDPEEDDLYREELDFWEKIGAVVIHRSFSRAPEKSDGHKHINEVILADRQKLVPLWDEGARVYVCGSRGLGESVKQAFLKLAKEKAEAEGKEATEDRLEKWFEKLRNERYSTDVFA